MVDGALCVRDRIPFEDDGLLIKHVCTWRLIAVTEQKPNNSCQ